jgi:hypothetical protein
MWFLFTKLTDISMTRSILQPYSNLHFVTVGLDKKSLANLRNDSVMNTSTQISNFIYEISPY